MSSGQSVAEKNAEIDRRRGEEASISYYTKLVFLD